MLACLCLLWSTLLCCLLLMFYASFSGGIECFTVPFKVGNHFFLFLFWWKKKKRHYWRNANGFHKLWMLHEPWTEKRWFIGSYTSSLTGIIYGWWVVLFHLYALCELEQEVRSVRQAFARFCLHSQVLSWHYLIHGVALISWNQNTEVCAYGLKCHLKRLRLALHALKTERVGVRFMWTNLWDIWIWEWKGCEDTWRISEVWAMFDVDVLCVSGANLILSNSPTSATLQCELLKRFDVAIVNGLWCS